MKKKSVGVVAWSLNSCPGLSWPQMVLFSQPLFVVRFSYIYRGGEDDELQNRCKALGIKWDWPRDSKHTMNNAIVDLEDMNLDEKLKFLKQHKEWKCIVKWEALDEHAKTWKTNGLSDLHYKILSSRPLDSPKGGSQQSRATKITVDVKLNGQHWSNEKSGVDLTWEDVKKK